MMREKQSSGTQNEPKKDSTASLGPIEGRWEEVNDVGYYVFDLPLEEPSDKAYSHVVKTLREHKSKRPVTFSEKYVSFIESLRRRVAGG